MDSKTPANPPAGNVVFWLLLLLSLLTWPLFFLTYILLAAKAPADSPGPVAFMLFYATPALSLLNVLWLCTALYLAGRFPPRNVVGIVGATLAILHSGFIAVSGLIHMASF
jgi:hypothetical protein